MDVFGVPSLDDELFTKRPGGRIVVDDEMEGDFSLEDPENKRFRQQDNSRMSIKFLISNLSAGFLIGKAGAAIIELQSSTKARVNIAQSGDLFPGTLERAVLVAGTLSQIISCQAMIWKRMAPSLRLERDEEDNNNNNNYILMDDDIIVGKLLIPASASGLIIGRGGAVIQMISEMSGAKIQLSAKEDAVFTHERAVNIQGTLAACIKATSQIITKLSEDEEINKYVNPSTSYDNMVSNISQSVYGRGGNGNRRSRDGTDPSRVVTIDRSQPASPPSVFTETLSATTTINMAVPDQYVGLILGPGGSHVADITRFTGAKITVSRRGEYIEGTQNRSVTIVGTPQAAQAAHLFIAEKVKHAATGAIDH
jgi:RNA-binding protein Nova